jgi:HSP20 family protein
MISGVTRIPEDGAADAAADIRRLLLEIEKDVPLAAAPTADCRPALDIVETATAVEVLVDVPGVTSAAVRVAIRDGTLLIVGSKLAAPWEPRARYHLAERSYGRFARIVRLTGAFDARGARAFVGAGELRVVLPLLQDRRGEMLPIPVEPA